MTLKTGALAGALTAPQLYKCTWIHSSGAPYYGGECPFTIGASDTLKVTAPVKSDIDAGWWKIRMTSYQKNTATGREGMTYKSTAEISVASALIYSAGTTLIGYGQDWLDIPTIASDAGLTVFTSTKSMSNLIVTKLRFPATIPTTTGLGTDATSDLEFVLTFDTNVLGPNLGSTVVNAAGNNGLTDCFFGVAAGWCYIRKGSVTP